MRTALAAWQMGSQWSLAAAIHAKGSPADQYDDLFEPEYQEVKRAVFLLHEQVATE